MKDEESEDMKIELTYEKCGAYLIPNLIPNRELEGERKFGRMRWQYLKEQRSGVYSGLLLTGKLKEHLLMVQEQAEQMAESEVVREEIIYRL